MKGILKGILLVAFGFAVGSGITAYLMKRYYQGYLAEIYAMDAGANAMLAWHLHYGNADIVLRSTEEKLVRDVVNLSKNDELKHVRMAEVALTSVKEYYVCTKTEFPAEIAEIMNSLPTVPESKCTVN